MSLRDREQQLRELHPDEPWMWRESWVNRRMVYSNRTRSLGLAAPITSRIGVMDLTALRRQLERHGRR